MLDHSEWGGRWDPRNWRDALQEGIEGGALLARIREATQTGRPLAEPDFVVEPEGRLRWPLRPQKRGPKPKAAVAGAQGSFGI